MTTETDLEKVMRNSDIVLPATPSHEPMIQADWVKPGTHFSCIGANMSGKQEIETELFRNARIFGDDSDQCFSVGECEKPYLEGIISKLDAEIGEVLLGTAKGRAANTDSTIFDSTGIALQDLASAALILDAAKVKGMGTAVEL